MVGFRKERHMQCDDIGIRQQLFGTDVLDVFPRSELLAGELVEGKNTTPKTEFKDARMGWIA